MKKLYSYISHRKEKHQIRFVFVRPATANQQQNVNKVIPDGS